MTDPRLDPNELAALMEGRLGERERAALLARLADDDEAREVLAEAAVLAGEMEAPGSGGAGSGTPVIPLRPGTPARRWPWLAAAAVVAGLALGVLLWSGGGAGDAVGRPLAMLEADAGPLPAGWDEAPWPATRSAVGPLTEEARAGRLGARLVQLELAVAAGDPALSPLAAEIAALLEPVPAAGPVADRYRRIGGEGGASAGDLRDARRSVAELVERDALELGAWTAAARVAAYRGDAEFFRDRGVLERAAASDALSPRVREQVERVRGAVEGRWGQLAEELARLMGVLGGG